MDVIALTWIIAGILIILTELFVTGFVAVFFGLGALVTGVAVALGLPGTGPWPFVLFSVVSIASLLALRGRFARWFQGARVGDAGTDSGTDEDFIGRAAEVIEAFDGDGWGRVSFRGAAWSARADAPLAEGARVVIVSRENLTLNVAPMEGRS